MRGLGYRDRSGHAGVSLGVVRRVIDGFSETIDVPYASLGLMAFVVPYLVRFLLDLLNRAWGGNRE